LWLTLLNKVSNNNPITISPNPVFDALHVTLNTNEQLTQVSIFNAAGVKVFEQTVIKNNTLLIDVKNYSAGNYVVSVQTNQGLYNKNITVTK
jgi:hypothetical protein